MKACKTDPDLCGAFFFKVGHNEQMDGQMDAPTPDWQQWPAEPE